MHRLRHRHVAEVVETRILDRQLLITIQPAGDIDLRNLLLGDLNQLSDYRSSLKKTFRCLACGLAFWHKEKVRHKGTLSLPFQLAIISRLG